MLDQPQNSAESAAVEPTGAPASGNSIHDAVMALRAKRPVVEDAPEPTDEIEQEPTSQPDDISDEVTERDEPETDDIEDFEMDEDGADAPTDPDVIELDDDRKILLDGEEFTAQDIRDNRMRIQDYVRKTTEAATIRKNAEEIQQLTGAALQVMKARFDARLQKWNDFNWSEATADPTEFQKKRLAYEADKADYESFAQEVQQQAAQYQAAIDQQREQAAKHANAVLSKTVKDWNQNRYMELMEFAAGTYEAPTDVLSQVTDPWIFRMAADALAYRKGRKVATKKMAKPAARSVKRGKSRAPVPDAEKALSRSIEAVQKRSGGSRISDDEVNLLRNARAAGKL